MDASGSRRRWVGAVAVALLALAVVVASAGRRRPASPDATRAASVPIVEGVELQPLRLHATRIVEALAAAGAPLDDATRSAIEHATTGADVQRALDRYALAAVVVNPEARVRALRGPAAAELDEAGWRTMLLKIVNEAGTTAPLSVSSPQGGKTHLTTPPPWAVSPDASITQADVRDRWIGLEVGRGPGLPPELSGLGVEYRLLHVYCGDRDQGAALSDRDRPDGGRHVPRTRAGGSFQRAATLAFAVGGASDDLGHRSELDVLFSCRPAVDVVVRVRDESGRPAVASLVVTDREKRTYPPRAKRLAPDFFFERQVYRDDGEVITLPPGDYDVESSRGPEYVPVTSKLHVADGATPIELPIQLRRWIDPSRAGWVSGDHHVHAAGCAHYESPTQGVFPEDVFRHLLGEDLHVAAVLTWGPCWFFQKQFFTGEASTLSTDRHVMRYDLEVSGFGSHRAGHIVLLGLRDQQYPGAKTLDDWPHLGTSILRWAKRQGATTGTPHSGNGMEVPGEKLPSDDLAKCDGIGANELVVDVTHTTPGPDGADVPLVDFVSAVDTPYVWELNVWYHLLDAGFRTRLAGETDFPCIYEDRIGHGRSYVKLDDPAHVDFDAWTRGLRGGRAYVSEGNAHILDFTVSGAEVGDELRLGAPGTVRATARVAARLDETPRREIHDTPYTKMPFWDVERARIGASREVPVELVVDGAVAAKTTIVADGTLHDVSFDGVAITRSSWVAMRILPAAHTNAVFVVVADKPIRSGKRSIGWLRRMVDVCWAQKKPTYLPSEIADAERDYDHARQVYDRRMSEAEAP